jgi:hypothetical protein
MILQDERTARARMLGCVAARALLVNGSGSGNSNAPSSTDGDVSASTAANRCVAITRLFEAAGVNADEGDTFKGNWRCTTGGVNVDAAAVAKLEVDNGVEDDATTKKSPLLPSSCSEGRQRPWFVVRGAAAVDLTTQVGGIICPDGINTAGDVAGDGAPPVPHMTPKSTPPQFEANGVMGVRGENAD